VLDASRQHGGLIVKGRNVSEELRDLRCTAEEASELVKLVASHGDRPCCNSLESFSRKSVVLR